ncbi:hypothetical protein GGU11DRAFT_760970, partial [Lentinula aff. detonsa]
KHNNASHYPHESALNPVSTFIWMTCKIANPHKSSLLLFRTTCYPYSLVPFYLQQAASTLLLSTFPFIFHQLPVAMPQTVYAVCMAFIHDVTIMYHGERFRVYFRRYRMLPTNPLLKVNGGIVILCMGKQNPLNPINMQRGDTKKARAIARKFAPYLAWFQEDCL